MILIHLLLILVFFETIMVFKSTNVSNILSTILILYLTPMIGMSLPDQLQQNLPPQSLKIAFTKFLILPIAPLKVPLNMIHWKINRVLATILFLVSLCTIMSFFILTSIMISVVWENLVLVPLLLITIFWWVLLFISSKQTTGAFTIIKNTQQSTPNYLQDTGDFTDPPPPLPDSWLPLPLTHPDPSPVFLVDATYANCLHKRCSTNGYTIMLAGGTISYHYKTQSVTTLSSTKVEFYAAISADKDSLFLWHVLFCLDCSPTWPTKIYEDNEASINVVDTRYPTEQKRCIETPYFCIQD